MKGYRYKVLIMIIIGILSAVVAITGGILMGFGNFNGFSPMPLGIVSIVVGAVGLIADVLIAFFWWD